MPENPLDRLLMLHMRCHCGKEVRATAIPSEWRKIPGTPFLACSDACMDNRPKAEEERSWTATQPRDFAGHTKRERIEMLENEVSLLLTHVKALQRFTEIQLETTRGTTTAIETLQAQVASLQSAAPKGIPKP